MHRIVRCRGCECHLLEVGVWDEWDYYMWDMDAHAHKHVDYCPGCGQKLSPAEVYAQTFEQAVAEYKERRKALEEGRSSTGEGKQG